MLGFTVPSAMRSPGVLAGVLVAAVLLTATAPVPAANLRDDGLLEVNGEPMFPIGLVELGTYFYDDWQQRIIDAGANLVWDIEIAYADTTPTCAQVMQAAVDGGYYLMIGSGDTWNWDNPATPELEVNRLMYEINETQGLMNCISAHPDRVVAFANRDEPVWTIARNQVGDIDEVHVRETYTQLHTLRPDALVAMNFAPAHLSQNIVPWKANIHAYRTATDIMMFAAYPYPAGPGTCGQYNVLGYPECKMDRLAVGADIFLSELNDPGQPLWMIIQGFKNIPLKEARWEAAASIIHGATGILWAGWSWWHELGNGNTTWPVTQQVMSEFSRLQPWLVGHDVAGAVSSEPDVELRALEAQGEIVVFAISRNGFSGSATLELPQVNQRRVRVLNEGRRLPHQDGVITDTFEPYQAHIYRYSALGSESISRPTGGTDAPDVEIAADRFSMEAYPNPSAGRTTVRFRLPQPATALFTVYDAAGRRVAVVGRGNYGEGAGSVVWDGRDLSGQPVAPGAYFVRGRTTNGESATARVLIRH